MSAGFAGPVGAVDAEEPSQPEAEAAHIDRLEQMDERLERLEQELIARDDELRAARSELESQQRELERAGVVASDPPLAGAFERAFDVTELRGWVATSYWWNFNDPFIGVGANRGNPALGRRASGLGFPYHPDHNSFQIDQVWFAASKRATESSRGGFAFDLVFGKTADVLRGAAPTRADLSAVYQAYVEYLAPLGPGVQLTFGRFETHIGVETLRAPDNPNVTRGIVKTQLEPVSHTGLKAETHLGPFRAMIGIANDAILDPDTDFDNGKAFLWALGVPLGETLDLQVAGVWGSDGLLPGSAATVPIGNGFEREDDKLGIVDLVVRWTPADVFETYLVADYAWSQRETGIPAGSPGPPIGVPGDPRAWGLAVGSLFAVSEQTDFGFRGEVVIGKDNFLDPFVTTQMGDQTIWSITGTLAHRLSDPLLVRFEGRYEGGEISGPNARLFLGDRPGDFKNQEFVAGVEAVYTF